MQGWLVWRWNACLAFVAVVGCLSIAGAVIDAGAIVPTPNGFAIKMIGGAVCLGLWAIGGVLMEWLYELKYARGQREAEQLALRHAQQVATPGPPMARPAYRDYDYPPERDGR